MKQDEPILELTRELGLDLHEDQVAASRKLLIEHVNGLVANDLQKLISILYRMDINESKLRALLNDNPATDAGVLIAEMMIERQAQKIRSRQQYRQRDNDIDEEEKW